MATESVPATAATPATGRNLMNQLATLAGLDDDCEVAKGCEATIDSISARHEKADNKLCQAQAILGVLQESKNADERSRANAAWAAQELIEEARAIYGKF